MKQIQGLKLVRDCGYHNRTIYIIEGSDKIQIGCTSYTKQDAIKAIKESYNGPSQLDYINRVNECYITPITPWSILKDDVDYAIRSAVASQGHHLEQLKYDSRWAVRLEVAKQGHFLEQFKKDVDYDVRREVAKQGQYLEQLKDDKHWRVRLEVARQGKYLEQLKDDEKCEVRREVAKQGNYLVKFKWFIQNLNIQKLLK